MKSFIPGSIGPDPHDCYHSWCSTHLDISGTLYYYDKCGLCGSIKMDVIELIDGLSCMNIASAGDLYDLQGRVTALEAEIKQAKQEVFWGAGENRVTMSEVRND